MFRVLKNNEIDVRVQSINEKGCTLLLYKDARCDMNILDETVGAMNWKREHTRDNANCIVSIWDENKKQWVGKEDTGTESFTEKEKGLASDSFKRACFNWGIGRELYTSPFIWIPTNEANITSKIVNGKETWICKDKFYVSFIRYTADKEIKEIEIKNSKNKIVFSNKEDQFKDEPISDLEAKILTKTLGNIYTSDQIEKTLKKGYNADSINELTKKQMADILHKLKNLPERSEE